MKTNQIEKSQKNSNRKETEKAHFFNNKNSTNVKSKEKINNKKTKDILESEVKDDNILHINKDYAEKFDYLKRKEAIEKAKQKYGEDYFFKEEEESDQESEDSNAELINDRILEKFVDTIVKLQDDEKVKEFVNTDKPIFEEEDFKVTNKNKSNTKEKAFTIKDVLLRLENDNEEDKNPEEDIYSVNYKEKKMKKLDKEKEDFLKMALEADDQNDPENHDFVDDGFLKVKKTNENEEKYFKELESRKLANAKKANDKRGENELDKETPDEIVNMNLDEILKKRKNTKNIEALKKFWGEGQALDANEKFLRNYILSEAWMENDENYINRQMYLVDKEDEQKDQYFEEFEERYNFRYEEEGGANITTHKRDLETYRIKDDTRKKKRDETKLRKTEEKEKVISDLQIAKEARKSELKSKIDNIEKIAGTDKIKELAEELEKEFDPENFDKIMSKIYNDEYYQQFDHEEDIKEAIEEKMFDFKTNKSIPNKEKVLEMQKLEEEGFENENQEMNKSKKAKQEKNQQSEQNDENNNDDENENGENEWFYCDNCIKAIKENKIKYDCETCQDYTLCKECFSKVNHAHQMKKSKVPLGCKPPQNWRELVEAVKKTEELICCLCNEDIINNYYFICEECDDGNKYCKTCRGQGKSIHEHKLTKFVMEEEKNEETDNLEPRKKLEKLIDEKYDTVVDDVIAGHIPTKFHYAKVKGHTDNDELTDDMLLYLDDQTLNKYLPLKTLAPYKDGFIVPGYKKKRLLSEFQREVDKRKRELLNEIKQKKQIAESNQSLLQKKHLSSEKSSNSKLEKEEKNSDSVATDKKEYRKKKRLETYGITQ